MKTLSRFIVFGFILLFSAEVHAACTFSATGIIFGVYDTFVPTPLDTTGTVTVNCDKTMGPPPDITILISASSNSGLVNPRQMKHATLPDRLDYNLYTKQNKTSVWGDGTGGTSTVVIKGTKQKTVTIYGSIPAQQNVSAGNYSDILTITITP